VGFSFFKRDTKDSRPANTRLGTPTRTPSAPARPAERSTGERPAHAAQRPALGRPTGAAFAVTENAIPDRELQRSLAMATAAKIDAIESEMARDFLRPRKAAPEAAPAAAVTEQSVVVEAAPAPEEQAAAPPQRASEPSEVNEEDFDPGSEMLGGSADAIEVQAESSSALEEAAVLFANRQDELAEAGLRGALHTDPNVAGDERAWLMLLEFLLQRNDRAGFDQVCEAFVARFGVAAPSWFLYTGPEPAPAPVESSSGLPTVRLGASINSSIVKPLEEFKALAVKHPALELDVSAARSIDLVGAELLLRVINAFKRASHELTLRGVEPLLVVVRSATAAGRRDPSDAAWMLALELQRLLGRQSEFEETGIEYCITYEVSPPSWEPPPLNIHVAGAASAAKAPAPPASPAGIEWKGDLGADADAAFTRIIAAARPGGTVLVDCRLLRRMAFSAASALLGVALRLSQTGTRIEFREVNSLVAGLLQVLGISGISEVHIRRG
jgi:ABC-type transporter Mla MlaB component